MNSMQPFFFLFHMISEGPLLADVVKLSIFFPT